MNRTVDLWVVYELLKRLTTPFSETEAFRLGIIDARGNVLRPQKTLSSTERKSWSSFDIVVNNLKRVLAKLPFGRVRFASYMAALWLLREPKVKKYMSEAKTQKSFLRFLEEDAPTNAAGTGAVAGLTGDPPMMKRPKFAGHDVFTVNDDVWSRCRMGKRKHARYDAYVGEDETGKSIRDFGVSNPKAPIMLQHHRTGAFMYLRYGTDHSSFDHINPKRESKKGK